MTLLLLQAAVLVSAATAVGNGAVASPESQILLTFMAQFNGRGAPFATWDASAASPCSWAGVLCQQGTVWGLKLENMGLAGPVSLDSLKDLQHFRFLSLMNNNCSGALPAMSHLPGLRSVYFSNNDFSGKIPDDAFVSSRFLSKLYLANNNLSGDIPSSLTKLNKLFELSLENNKFEGSIPDLGRVKRLNVSSNLLSGAIPNSLSKMRESSFIGNEALCGPPLSKPCSAPPPTASAGSAAPPPSKSKTTTLIIAVAIAVASIALTAICGLILIIVRSHQRSSSQSPQFEEAPVPSNARRMKATGTSEHGSAARVGNNKGEPGKLCFLREGDDGWFELADLLKASAEILGSGCFGSSYKAGLVSGPVMVVKRFRQMNNVNRDEFQEHMRRLGRFDHPNLIPLVAYYYRKEEKLLITEYIQNGSLAMRLHGSHSQGLPPLDWPARLNIVKGVARGLSYLYSEVPSLVAPHGHLKSSNVLLSQTLDPILTDYALVPVTNQDHAHRLLVGYKSPEFLHLGRITKKTDVWSLGILILEILTGKVPAKFLQPSSEGSRGGRSGRGGSGSDGDWDLGTWVDSIASQRESSEVFDELMGRRCEREMAKLLGIGLSCCEEDVEKRLDVREAAERIEGVRDFDEKEVALSSDGSTNGEVRYSRG